MCEPLCAYVYTHDRAGEVCNKPELENGDHIGVNGHRGGLSCGTDCHRFKAAPTVWDGYVPPLTITEAIQVLYLPFEADVEIVRMGIGRFAVRVCSRLVGRVTAQQVHDQVESHRAAGVQYVGCEFTVGRK